MKKGYKISSRVVKLISFFLTIVLLFGLVLSVHNVAVASEPAVESTSEDNSETKAESPDNVEEETTDEIPEESDIPDEGPSVAEEEIIKDESETDKKQDISGGKSGKELAGPKMMSASAGDSDGTLTISKVKEQVNDYTNQWKITLTLEGKDMQVEKPADIVLVLDKSGSMGDGNRLKNAKSAAINFVNTLLKDGSGNRIALVHFADNVTVYNSSDPFRGAIQYQRNGLINAINGLNAYGGTFTQDAIYKARSILNEHGRSNVSKYIVLLSDGEPTYSLNIKDLSTQDFYQSGGRYYTRDNLTSDKFQYTGFYRRVGDGTSMTTRISGSYYYHHGNSAVAESRFAKSAGYTIYTIAFSVQAGSSEADILRRIASENKAYTATTSNINQILQQIAEDILIAARDAVVTDPIGEMFSLLDPSQITVSKGTFSWNADTETITWNIGDISEKDGKITMTYYVKMDIEADSETDYPMNKPTYVTYINPNNVTTTQYFNIPEGQILNIPIEKIITGNMGDKAREFPFKVRVTGTRKKGYDNELEFELSDGGKQTLYHIPYDAVITLEEMNNFGYTVTVKVVGENNQDGVEITDSEGKYTINLKADSIKNIKKKKIVVINKKDVVIPTGVLLDSLPYVIILAVVIAGIAIMVLRRRRISSEE